MKLNRSILLVLALVLSVAMVTTGTLAYLTDTEQKVNVFTIGNVDIELDEPEWVDNSQLMPGIPVPKDPQITNVGENSAWSWMTVTIPSALYPHLTLDYSDEWIVDDEVETTTVDGVDMTVVTLYYPELLAPEDVTPPAFESVTLNSYIDADKDGNLLDADGNPIGWKLTDAHEITVDAFAIQDKPFTDVEDAYDAYNKSGAYAPTVDAGSEDFDEAVADGNNVNLTEDVATDSTTIDDDDVVTIDLQDNALTTVLTNNGELTVTDGTLNSDTYGLENFGDATLSDLTVNAGNTGHYAVISQTGSTTTFDDVDLTSGGGGVAAVNGAKVEFNSGSVNVDSASTSGRYLFYAEGEGSEITINDGDFSFSSTKNQKRAYICAMDGTTVYVTGGTFGPASTRSGYTAGIKTDGTGKVIITGGTFGFDPTTWVADGYVATKDGSTWTVTAE